VYDSRHPLIDSAALFFRFREHFATVSERRLQLLHRPLVTGRHRLGVGLGKDRPDKRRDQAVRGLRRLRQQIADKMSPASSPSASTGAIASLRRGERRRSPAPPPSARTPRRNASVPHVLAGDHVATQAPPVGRRRSRPTAATRTRCRRAPTLHLQRDNLSMPSDSTRSSTFLVDARTTYASPTTAISACSTRHRGSSVPGGSAVGSCTGSRQRPRELELCQVLQRQARSAAGGV
jgi:hypothetical protein